VPNAIRFHQTGGPELLQWEEVELGEPGEGQARVRQTAVGQNSRIALRRTNSFRLLPAGSVCRWADDHRLAAWARMWWMRGVDRLCKMG
jgi:hypothetical protein